MRTIPNGLHDLPRIYCGGADRRDLRRRRIRARRQRRIVPLFTATLGALLIAAEVARGALL